MGVLRCVVCWSCWGVCSWFVVEGCGGVLRVGVSVVGLWFGRALFVIMVLFVCVCGFFVWFVGCFVCGFWVWVF